MSTAAVIIMTFIGILLLAFLLPVGGELLIGLALLTYTVIGTVPKTLNKITMKLFNAIQIVVLLVLGPLLVPLLKTQVFYGASTLMYILAAGWTIMFVWVIAMVWDWMDDHK